MRHSAALALTLALAPACSPPDEDVNAESARALGAGTYAPVSSFGANPGALRMYLYSPPGVAAENAPLVLFLHGCTQQASDARNVGWEKLADARGFYLAYPEQPSANNPVNCFNWAGEYGDQANLIRGQGENQSIASMVEHMKTTYKVDPRRVYIAGFSAGGGMVPVMLATWPDLFAAGAVNSGLPYRCATTVNDAYSCQLNGRDRSPADWAKDVRDAYPGFAGPYPRVTIWHGSSDSVVVPLNQRELRDQWTAVQGLGQTPDQQDTLGGQARARYVRDGVTVVETVTISGMAHGVSVDPRNGCGTAGSFVLDKGLCSAQHQADFFFGGAAPPPPPPGKAPVVNIDAPGEAATVSGSVDVRGRVSDEDDAVTTLELAVDGATKATVRNPGATFQLAWDTATAPNGAHRVTVTATDQAGHKAGATVNVRVSNMGGGGDETASGTCTQHYIAGRFRNAGATEVSRYLACGRCNGYLNAVTLYRFGTRWTDSATGMGCMDR